MRYTALILLFIVIAQHIYIRWLRKEVSKRDKAYNFKSQKELIEIKGMSFPEALKTLVGDAP